MVVKSTLETKEVKFESKNDLPDAGKRENSNKKKHDFPTVRSGGDAVQKIIEKNTTDTSDGIEAALARMLQEDAVDATNRPNVMSDQEWVFVSLESDPNFLQTNRAKKAIIGTMLKEDCPFGVLTDPNSHTGSGALIAYKDSTHFVAGFH